MSISVIGVVGGTTGAKEDALRLAESIGTSIAKSRSILITGGEADKDEPSVKAQAMCAALSAATPTMPVGAVGVIPKKLRNPAVQLTSWAASSSAYCLYLYTGVSSHERNILTGQLADVLIALPGEKGTLSEIAYAINANRPIVFLDSWQELRSYFQNNFGLVESIIRDLSETTYQPDKLVESLGSLFDGSLKSGSYAVLNGVSSEHAVEAALLLGRATRRVGNRYPKLQSSKLRAFGPMFEAELQKLEQRVGP